MSKNCILTHTRRWVDPTAMAAADIDIRDIAHALAMKCRYSGHCPGFYSVAQHSVIVSRLCEKNPLAGLLHDAHEAYLADIATPVKRSLRECGAIVFDVIAAGIDAAVCECFNLPTLDVPEVREADKAAFDVEWAAFFGNGVKLDLWDWQRAETTFLAEYEKCKTLLTP